MSDTDAKVAPQTEEKKSKKARPKKEVKEPAVGTRSSGRVTKPVEKLTYKDETPEAKPVEIAEGKGEKLGDIENVEFHINKKKTDDAALKKLHTILFPSARAKRAAYKKNIRQFSGFADTSADHHKAVVEKLHKVEVKLLKDIADMLDLEHSGNKDEISERIAAFLEKPAASGNPRKTGSGTGKRKASKSKTTKKGTKAKGEGRKPSGFILFSKDNRAAVKKENPEASFGEIGKLIGAKWQALSDEEKAKYNTKAAAAGGSGSGKGKRKAAPKAKKGSKKAKKNSEESKEEEAEDEEEAEAEEEEEDAEEEEEEADE